MSESSRTLAGCPECQFTYGWNGQKCSHCYPPPEQLRKRWEEFAEFSRIVDFRKTYIDWQLAAISAACLRRAWDSLPDETKELTVELEAEGKTRLIGQIVRNLSQKRGNELAHIAPSERWLEFMKTAQRVVEIAKMSRALICKVAFPDRILSSFLQEEFEKQKVLFVKREEAVQCDIARDVIGYPEPTVTFEAEWANVDSMRDCPWDA